jgi:hypothetical protein
MFQRGDVGGKSGQLFRTADTQQHQGVYQLDKISRLELRVSGGHSVDTEWALTHIRDPQMLSVRSLQQQLMARD